MPLQLACFLTPIIGDASGYKWAIANENDALTMHFSGSIDRLPDGTKFPPTKDYEHSGDPEIVVTAGLTLVYITGDESDIATLAALSAYHLFWMIYTDLEAADTILMPLSNSANADLIALRDYIAAHTGKTNDQIVTWLGAKFGVATADVQAKVTSKSRLWLVRKMMNAMRRWSETKAELDAIV